MASGHWENRIVQKIDEDTGRRYNVTIRVWVPDKPTGPNSAANAARRAAARRAKAAAAAAARARARAAADKAAKVAAAAAKALASSEYQKKLAAERAKAYAALQQKQSALVRRAGLVRSGELAPPVPAPVVPLKPNRGAAAIGSAAAAATKAALASAAAEQKRVAAVREAQLKARLSGVNEGRSIDRPGVARRPDAYSGPSPTSGVKTAKDARDAEKIIKKAVQDAANGKTTSPEVLRGLAKNYDAYASTVYEQYRASVAALNALLEKAKKGDEKAWARAKTLFYGDYAKHQKEFARMFGDGSNPKNDGSYNDFYKDLDSLALAQRNWWKNQMKAALQSRLLRLERLSKTTGEDFSKELQTVRNQLALYNEDPAALGLTIDHYEMYVDSSGKEHARPVYRKKTLEEALNDQQAQMIMEQQKQYAAALQAKQASYLRDRKLLSAEGLVRHGDSLVTPQEARFRDDLTKAIPELWGSNIPTIKRSEDLQKVADQLLGRWERLNPPPAVPTMPRGTLAPGYRRAYAVWKANRDAYEKQVYGFFGSGVPGFLERLTSVPGVSHGFAAFQGGVAAIGATGRIAIKRIRGQSELDLGLHVSDLPDGIRQKVEAAMREAGPIRDPWGGSLAIDIMAPQRSGQAKQNVLDEWFKTPEGAAWLKKHTADKLERLNAEDAAFLKGFYGEGDLGDKLDALNAFGSKPFSDDAANLLFNLLADPTNAVPLKFTTWLARGRYVKEMMEQGSKLKELTSGRFARNFVAVDEGVLKLEKELGQFEKELASKGLSPEQAANELRQTLAGIEDAAKKKTAFEQWMQRLGLDPRKINEGQIFNLAEYRATKYAEQHGNLFTQQKKLAQEIKARQAADRKLAAKRLSEQRAAKQRLEQAKQRTYEEGKAAQKKLANQRESDEGKLAPRIRTPRTTKVTKADAGQPVVAARKAKGKPSAPAKPPKPPHVRETVDPTPPVLRETHDRVVEKVKQGPTYKEYDPFDEHYTYDAVGNPIPIDPLIRARFQNKRAYRELEKKAKAGDADARAVLADQAERMRNAWRMTVEDEPSVRVSKFTPGEFDVLDRAGLVGDDAAAAVMMRNRETVRHMKRVAAAGNADPYIAGFRQESGFGERAPALGHNVNPTGTSKKSGKVQATDAKPKQLRRGDKVEEITDDAASTDFIDTGMDLLDARASFRGLHEIYDSFTHHSLRYYAHAKGNLGLLRNLMNPEWVQRLNNRSFLRVLNGLHVNSKLDDIAQGLTDDAMLGEGAVAWRDGGLAVFEIFHQLRLAGKVDRLQELSHLVDEMIEADPTNVFAWEWKVLQVRTGFIGDSTAIFTGFKDAARAFGIDPDLALASIPNGYYAQRPPLQFGLSPNLRIMADSDDWVPAPASWRRKHALNAVTDIFTRGTGEPMQVVHYVAKQFGDFVKGTPIQNRVMGELTHASALLLGVDEMVERLLPHIVPESELGMNLTRLEMRVRAAVPNIADDVDIDGLRAIAERRGIPFPTPREILHKELSRQQRTIGSNKNSFLRPDYPGVREEVWRAYWAGDLPIQNARAHQLMYLIHLQNTGLREAMVDQTRVFMKYMRDIGKESEAQQFLQKIHSVEFQNLNARYVAQKLAGVNVDAKDPISGQSMRFFDSKEWQMWREMGFTPDDARLAKREKEIQAIRAEANSIERTDAARAKWLDDERKMPGDENTGVISESYIEDLADRIVETSDTSKLFVDLAIVVRKIADTGGLLMTAGDNAHLARIVESLRSRPDGHALLRRLQDSVGEGLLAERVAGAGERFAYQEAVIRLRMAAMELPSGGPKPSFKRAHAQLQQQLDDLLKMRGGTLTIDTVVQNSDGDWVAGKMRLPKKSRRGKDAKVVEMRDEYMKAAEPAKTPDEVKVEPVLPDPVAAAKNAGQERLLTQLSGLSEEEWWAHLKDAARKVLKNPRSSNARRAWARDRLASIEYAEYAAKVDRERGTHVPWTARAKLQARVLAFYGKKAEDYIAPNVIAPYADDIHGATVEQTRTWWGLLRRAPEESAISRVGSLGPKRTENYFPIDLFEEVEQAVSAAIREARGWSANTLTKSRGSYDELKKLFGEEGEIAASRMADKDPAILAAKKKVLDRYGISMDAYDEARYALWKGYVQKRVNEWILRRADAVVETAKRLGAKNATREKAYLGIRARLAREEARRRLGGLAFGELFGNEPQAIFDEFVARYTNDGSLRDFRPPLSEFQKRTLQEAVKRNAGLSDLAEPGGLAAYLQSANMPPFEKGREAVRNWLVKHGQWSPRKAEDIAAGHLRSWDIDAEADYWRTNFGFVPEWTDRNILGGPMKEMFHNEELYYLQMRAWGIFNKSNELKLRLDGTDAKKIEEMRLKGDPVLGSSPRRELEEQRRYVIERYGDLVSENGKLTAMPWLMHDDELLEYMSRRGSEGVPEGLIQTPDELAEFQRILAEELDPLMKKMVDEKAGAPIMYEDIYHVVSEVQARLLADPVWNKRIRDRLVGGTLDKWAGLNRWLIFSNPAFFVMNAVDVPIKTTWYRMSRRGLFNPGLHGAPPDVLERANALQPVHLGLDAQTTLYRLKQRKAKDYILNPRHKGIAGILERASGIPRFIPEAAGHIELAGKMNLARGMYPQVYARALKQLGDPELADVWAKNFIKNEIGRMWPVAGDGPFERLFNRFVPFSTYMVRNRVLFLSEAVAHPSMLNKIEFIGRAIEKENLKNWEEDPETRGTVMPDHLRRRIELPWAPGYYLDLGQFTDATRGLKPLYTLGEDRTVLDRISDWVRVINPSAQAGIYMITNALGITKRTMYRPVLDENNFPTGEYTLVTTGWTEPWSNDQPDVGSVFWFVDAIASFSEFSANGWTSGEISQMVGQATMFNAISTYDRGSALYTAYKGMLAADREGAKAWLNETPNGRYLKMWLQSHVGGDQEVKNALVDFDKEMNSPEWFKISAADRAAIKAGRKRIDDIRAVYAAKLATLQRGTLEFNETKAQMYYLINQEYLSNPALMKNEVWSKTPAEWAEQTESWQTDKLTDEYMVLSNSRPVRSAYETTAQYNAAVSAWQSAKRLFLKTYPQVEKRLGGAIAELDAVRDAQNKEWDEILSRIGSRNEAISQAKEIIDSVGRKTAAGQDAQHRLDILYLQNELDYSLLEKDNVASYFQYEDFEKTPFGSTDPKKLRKGITLPRFTVLNDFDRTRYEKARREGRLDDFLAKEAYGKDMAAATLYAKGGDKFGEFDGAKFFKYMQDHPDLREKYFDNNPGKKAEWAASAVYVEGMKAAIAYAKLGGSFDPGRFVEFLKSRPKLLAAYFARNPGKKEQWAANDAYIKHISVWGKLASAGRWDEANAVWERLPQWVKDRYYAKHPEKRKRAAQTVEYLGYMKKWVSLFQSGNKEGAMKFFNSLPRWVRERYYEKHPEKRVEFETNAKMFEKLRNYFASDPANQAQYLKDNPDLQRWLAKNASSQSAKRMAILAAYRAIPKEEAWLRRVFREKYPEIFSQEAAGKRRMRSVYDSLVRHPEFSDEFEQWVKAIWDSYAEMLKHEARPRNSYIEPDRKVPARKFRKSWSAARASRDN